MTAKRILLVDDEPDVLEAVKGLMEMEFDGVAVTTAADADEALGILASERFDLIVTDFRMPGRTGLEMLRDYEGRGDTPCVLLTAYGEDQRAVDAARRGLIRRYFRKPPDADAFLAGMRELLHPESLSAEESTGSARQ